jgi:MarC family membrane protein
LAILLDADKVNTGGSWRSTLDTTFASATVLLLLVTDPFGNIPVFASALQAVPPDHRWRVILREHAIALVVLLVFMFLGRGLLELLGLRESALQLAGGVVLGLIAIRMIFPPAPGLESEPPQEPLVVPLAIPAIAGPSALATVILLASQAPQRRSEWIAALCITIVVGALILLLADRIQHVLGPRFVIAMERLMGLILVAVAVEMILRALVCLQ